MFTWIELVSLGLIDILKDPELVIYFVKILKPIRRDFVEEEAREWHESLRISKEDRWKSVAELSRARKFSLMNSSVPITCKLPFDGGMWRNSCLLLKSIHYFRNGFLKFPGSCRTERLDGEEEEMSYKQKINTVTLMLGDTLTSQNFRDGLDIQQIREALADFILFDDDDPPVGTYLENEEKPFIIVEKFRINGEDKPIMSIIN
ncbi:MAG: hypothetical protein CMK44_04465 [Porticoccus sp.]|nr:hypothetical protein [Porticoccus sp.]|tara:strand:+ start:155 stop:766 length:612 start_codon:yes stop_codon:yes gene_type:complete